MGIRSTIRKMFKRSTSAGAGHGLPTREGAQVSLSADSAVRLASVYRAISIITAAASQLPLDVERGGATLASNATPAFIRRPSLKMSRSDFIEQLVLALATRGNAYIRKLVDPSTGQILDLDPLDPSECWPVIDPDTGIKMVSYRGLQYSSSEIQHLALMSMPGTALGLGPIQAAQVELFSARDIRDYAAKWFTSTGQPAGILSTDQETTADHLTSMRNAWNYLDAEGNPMEPSANPSRVRVLSGGMKYQPIFINPKDAQWIEARQFSTTEIARLFGIPSSLMLAAVEGTAQTYSNVEQEWIAFTRFTLTAYLRKIEEALTALTPSGQTVRFNIEGLLRSDTKSRYEAHAIGIAAGFLTDDEVRKIEGLAPLTTLQRTQMLSNLRPGSANEPKN